MFHHGVADLVCLLIAALNIITAVILYRIELREGITVNTGTRRQAIMTCTAMCIIFGGVAIYLMMSDLVSNSHGVH